MARYSVAKPEDIVKNKRAQRLLKFLMPSDVQSLALPMMTPLGMPVFLTKSPQELGRLAIKELGVPQSPKNAMRIIAALEEGSPFRLKKGEILQPSEAIYLGPKGLESPEISLLHEAGHVGHDVLGALPSYITQEIAAWGPIIKKYPAALERAIKSLASHIWTREKGSKEQALALASDALKDYLRLGGGALQRLGVKDKELARRVAQLELPEKALETARYYSNLTRIMPHIKTGPPDLRSLSRVPPPDVLPQLLKLTEPLKLSRLQRLAQLFAKP